MEGDESLIANINGQWRGGGREAGAVVDARLARRRRSGGVLQELKHGHGHGRPAEARYGARRAAPRRTPIGRPVVGRRVRTHGSVAPYVPTSVRQRAGYAPACDSLSAGDRRDSERLSFPLLLLTVGCWGAVGARALCMCAARGESGRVAARDGCLAI